MKKYKYLIILFSVLLIFTGCSKKKLAELVEDSTNKSISNNLISNSISIITEDRTNNDIANKTITKKDTLSNKTLNFKLKDVENVQINATVAANKTLDFKPKENNAENTKNSNYQPDKNQSSVTNSNLNNSTSIINETSNNENNNYTNSNENFLDYYNKLNKKYSYTVKLIGKEEKDKSDNELPETSNSYDSSLIKDYTKNIKPLLNDDEKLISITKYVDDNKAVSVIETNKRKIRHLFLNNNFYLVDDTNQTYRKLDYNEIAELDPAFMYFLVDENNRIPVYSGTSDIDGSKLNIINFNIFDKSDTIILNDDNFPILEIIEDEQSKYFYDCILNKVDDQTFDKNFLIDEKIYKFIEDNKKDNQINSTSSTSNTINFNNPFINHKFNDTENDEKEKSQP